MGADGDTPYLMRGVTRMATDSSALVSSSAYLNDPDLRDWVALVMLRRNGPDFPPERETPQLTAILSRVQDPARLAQLVAEERKINPPFDTWVVARPDFSAALSGGDFPSGSLGAWLIEAGGEAAPVGDQAAVSDADWVSHRLKATFAIERRLIGAGPDHFGEMTAHFFRLAGLFKVLSPELAGELCVVHILGALRFLPRTILHYPQVWMTALDCMSRGDATGLRAPLFMAPLEDLLTLTPQAARERLGLDDVVDADTDAASRAWVEAADAPPMAASSTLVSTSKYLNHAGLRRWCAQEMLRKNGPDLPPPAGSFQMIQFLERDLQDYDQLDALFTRERKLYPALDAWFARGKIPTYTKDDLRRYPPGSVGARYLKYVDDNNFELDFHDPYEPTNHFQWVRRMRSRNHDIEHIVTGGGFDYMGELVPYYLLLTQLFRFFTPELAGALAQMYMFGSLRYTVRTVLHCPQAWPTAMASIQRGIRVGMASENLYIADYEPILHLSVAEAREALGVREAQDVDTSEMAWLWGAESHRAMIAASAKRAADTRR
jgi:ubiquinone biosynthesis protein COQ4